jgi:hypothetical protein
MPLSSADDDSCRIFPPASSFLGWLALPDPFFDMTKLNLRVFLLYSRLENIFVCFVILNIFTYRTRRPMKSISTCNAL